MPECRASLRPTREAPTCGYCGQPGLLRRRSELWRNASDQWLWVCSNYPACDAMVGCHDGSDQPYGTMARKRLRDLRRHCHQVFDPLWQFPLPGVTRDLVYRIASALFAPPGTEFHIGSLDEAGCEAFLDRVAELEEQIGLASSAMQHAVREPDQTALDFLDGIFAVGDGSRRPWVSEAELGAVPELKIEVLRCGLVEHRDGHWALTPRARGLLQLSN